ncbi:MAG: hypothetical protein ACP5HU_12160 [Phycisphaerae bacterium]
MSTLVKVAAMFLVVAVTAGTAVFADEGSMGAVKTGLYAREGGEGPADPGSGDWVGFAVLVADSDGMLWANVVVKGMEEGTYDVYVKTSGPYSGQLLGQVHVNRQGKGQVQVSTYVGLAEMKGDTVPVQVVVKAGGGSELVGAATATEDVPLKLPYEDDM